MQSLKRRDIEDSELEQALALSLTWHDRTLCAYTEELQLEQALSLSRKMKQPRVTGFLDRLSYERLLALVDVMAWTLKSQGSWRDLVSFFTVNTTFYRLYRERGDCWRREMMRWRILPPVCVDRVHSFRGKSCCGEEGVTVFVATRCDTAYSLTRDMFLYIREVHRNPRDPDRYFFQRGFTTFVERGLNCNQEAREFLAKQTVT